MPHLAALSRALILAALLLPASAARAQDEPPLGPHPARLHTGSCADLGPATDVVETMTYGFSVATQGRQVDRSAELGVRYLPLPLADLAAGDYVLVVEEHDRDGGDPVACGAIESSSDAVPDVLAVGLTETGGSGVIGIAYLVGLADGGTSVALFLAEPPTGEATQEATSEPSA